MRSVGPGTSEACIMSEGSTQGEGGREETKTGSPEVSSELVGISRAADDGALWKEGRDGFVALKCSGKVDGWEVKS